MAKIVVHRKGYVTKSGTRVKPSTFKVKDRGKPGHGKKYFEITRTGVLGEGFMTMPAARQHAILRSVVKKDGEMSVQGRLQALATFNKNVNPVLSRRAQELRSWVAANFEGTKYVGR